ncbi:hypothetical protein [Vibrio neptunius]|uniref:hypothetical protein n=1 Tax=Vibrio neptunius TaxID=170651 RepID=UPI001C5CB96F|nr:hypothetical protein [Vibrio neptunius]QXX08838.1 hypothetical protein KW548_17040 [Vibrio neptunius]
MNYIQEKAKGIDFYTSLINVENWLEISLSDYDWHISDIDGAWPELDDPSWVTGQELAAKISEFDYQFSWAVISAFPKGTRPFTTDEPFADGNSIFWEGIPEKQLKNAVFEIVCWDSSATLFIDLPSDLAKNLVANAPSIKDLNKVNGQRKS